MHPIRCGPRGWSYPEWAGVFYPKGMKAGDYVGYVAGQHPVVAVDSTFHAHRPGRWSRAGATARRRGSASA
jgi:uncharacterized protein YecE (DUF72 family)